MISPLQYQNSLRKIQQQLTALPYTSFVYNATSQRMPTNYDFPFANVDFECVDEELADYITGSGDYPLDDFDNVPFNKLPEPQQNRIILSYQTLANNLIFDLRPYALDFLNYLIKHTQLSYQQQIPSTVVEKASLTNGLSIYPDSIGNLLTNMRESRNASNTQFLYYKLSHQGVMQALFALTDNSMPGPMEFGVVMEYPGGIIDTNFGNMFGPRDTVKDYIHLFAPTDGEIIDFFYDLGVAAGYIIHLEDRFAVDLTNLKALYETVFPENYRFDLSLIAHRFLVDGIERESSRDYATTISTMKAFLDFNYDFKIAMDSFFRDIERSTLYAQLENYKIAASDVSQPKVIEFQNQFSW